jgi:S1-C subfamily serine protease
MLKYLKRLGFAAVTIFMVGNISFNQGQIHNSYLRWEVGGSTVQVLSPSLRGGGTGFAVKAASGKEFIMTNKHVCEAAIDGKVAIKQDGGKPVIKKVIYKDDKHDLCLVEGDKRFSPLDIGSAPDKGDFHYVVGHPGLRQLSVQQGEFIGNAIVELIDEVEKRSDCRGTIYELNPLEQFLYGMEFACFRSYQSYATTATTYPGNSGSPVVNKYGNIIGVLFAGSSKEEKDNYLVPVSEVKRVLSKF